MAQSQEPNQQASKGLLIAGYIFAFLGGYIGVAIGAYIKLGKIKDAEGVKVLRFNEDSRKQGLIILIIAVVSSVIWTIIRTNIH